MHVQITIIVSMRIRISNFSCDTSHQVVVVIVCCAWEMLHLKSLFSMLLVKSIVTMCLVLELDTYLNSTEIDFFHPMVTAISCHGWMVMTRYVINPVFPLCYVIWTDDTPLISFALMNHQGLDNMCFCIGDCVNWWILLWFIGWCRHRANPKSYAYEVIACVMQSNGFSYAGFKSFHIVMSVVDWFLWSLPGNAVPQVTAVCSHECQVCGKLLRCAVMNADCAANYCGVQSWY